MELRRDAAAAARESAGRSCEGGVRRARPGHSVLTEPIGSVFRFLSKFGSQKTRTDRFFSRVGTEKIRFRFFRFGSSYNRKNRIISPQVHKIQIKKTGSRPAPPFASPLLSPGAEGAATEQRTHWPTPRTRSPAAWLAGVEGAGRAAGELGGLPGGRGVGERRSTDGHLASGRWRGPGARPRGSEGWGRRCSRAAAGAGLGSGSGRLLRSSGQRRPRCGGRALGAGGRQGRGWSGHNGTPVPAEQAMGERPTVGRGAAAVRRAAGGDLAAATVRSADKGRGLAGWGGCGLAERALSWTESNACLGLGPANLVNGLKFGSSVNRLRNRNRTEYFGS